MVFYEILLNILTVNQIRPFPRKHCDMTNMWFEFNKIDVLKNVLGHKLIVITVRLS